MYLLVTLRAAHVCAYRHFELLILDTCDVCRWLFLPVHVVGWTFPSPGRSHCRQTRLSRSPVSEPCCITFIKAQYWIHSRR